MPHKYGIPVMRFRRERVAALLTDHPDSCDSLETAVSVMTEYPTVANATPWPLRPCETLLRDLIRCHDEINRLPLAVRTGKPASITTTVGMVG